jgi:hypothetical protein
MSRIPFEVFDFLTLHIVKTKKTPNISVVSPAHKKLVLNKESRLRVSDGRTIWTILTAPKWYDVRVKEKMVPEVSTLLLTPTMLTQWPNPIVQPLIEKIGEGEALVTFFGYENWDTYLGDSGRADKPLA